MYRVTAALPRLAVGASLFVSAVVVQHRVRKGSAADADVYDLSKGLRADSRQHMAGVGCRAASQLAPPAPPHAAVVGQLSSNILRRAWSMWLSIALGAAAFWAAVNASVVSTAKQLKVGAPAQHSQAQLLDAATIKQFCGHYVKVRESSESMDEFCSLFGVPRWLRQATRLMTGMDIAIVGDELIIKQVCKLSWLSAVETFPLDGSCSKPHKRRDMRAGKQTGELLEAHDGSMRVSVCWKGSLPGRAVDTLRLQQSDQGPVLVVHHQAQVEGRGTAQFNEVFRLSTS